MPPTLALAQRGVSSGVCVTPACLELSKTLLSYVNLNADPCSDFFQYTCGGWLNTDPVKENEESSNVFKQMQIRGLDEIVAFLHGSFEDLSKVIKVNDESYHTQYQMAVDKKNFQLIKDYYDTCLDEEASSILGATPIFPLIAAIENDLLPLTDVLDSKNLATALAALILQEVQTLFSAGVTMNPLDHNYNVVYLGQPHLNDSVTYSDIESLESYKTRLMQILSSILGGPYENSAYQQLVIEESRKSNFTLWSASKISKAINDFINFEVQLANIRNIETGPDSDVLPTLEELQLASPNIHWTTFLTNLVSADYVTSDLAIMFKKAHLEKLDALLSLTSVNTLQNYFVIQAVKAKLSSLKFPDGINPYTTFGISDFVAPTSLMFRAPSSRDPVIITPQQTCAKDTSNKFKNIVGRFFSLETFGASKEKKQAEEFVDNLHSTWLQNLSKTFWVDDETRTKIIHKIKVISKKVAYSTTSPDLRDPTTLEAYYDGVVITKKSYYDAVFSTTSWNNNRIWKSLERKKRDKNEWPDLIYPQLVNAFYTPLLNEIYIPVGMLQKPFYSPAYPEYMNYGGVGVIIGHEFVHSLDSSGRKYNAEGYQDDWFSASANETYINKSQCFIDQFNSFTLTGPDGVHLPVNGENVLAENIADGGGLGIAFNAYQNYIEKIGAPELTVPGFEKVTPEQLFFISHGLMTCATQKKADAQKTIDTDVHAPLYFRNIGAFQNSAQFAKTFNCPVGSPMNPIKKCSIW